MRALKGLLHEIGCICKDKKQEIPLRAFNFELIYSNRLALPLGKLNNLVCCHCHIGNLFACKYLIRILVKEKSTKRCELSVPFLVGNKE